MYFSRKFSASVLAILTALAASQIGASPVLAASLEGSWSGGGYVQPNSGKRERVRCRVSFNRQGAKVFGVSATCASASTTIRQTGQLLMVNPRRYIGDFYNSQYDISGRVRVTFDGSRLSVTFSSANGGGQLSLRRR
jgi:hypothetical protein